MKLFQMENWTLKLSEEIWGLSAFNKLLKRDKSKDKIRANAEMLFIFYFCDIKSDYLMMSEEKRIEELKHDILELGPDWEVDELVKDAIELYKKVSQTVIEKLYLQSLQSASDIGDYLEHTAALLAERDNYGKPTIDISKITMAVQKVPKLMADLKAAYKEVIKEQLDNDNKTKGKQKFNMFEDGL
jgi:hypothetical protein